MKQLFRHQSKPNVFRKAQFVYTKRRMVNVPEDLFEFVSLGIAAGLATKSQAVSVSRPKVSY